MGNQIFFNGGFHEETEKLLSVQDRGLTFGDGLFEVIRCVEGKFLLFSKHIGRMKDSAASLRMDFPYGPGELLEAARELSRRNGCTPSSARGGPRRPGRISRPSPRPRTWGTAPRPWP